MFDISDLANCDGATEGRTDTTSYRDAEAHLKIETIFDFFLVINLFFYPTRISINANEREPEVNLENETER